MKSKLFKTIVLLVTMVLVFVSIGYAKGKPIDVGPPDEESMDVNNLSVPVIFAESVGIKGGAITGATDVANTGFPRSFLYPYNNLDVVAPDITLDGTDVWYQKGEGQWQAEFALGSPGTVEAVDIDWGDNFASAKYYTNSIIRMENTMFLNGSYSLDGYEMAYVSGQGIDEVWGTTGTTAVMQPTVFSQNARLTIQKLEENEEGELVVTGEPIYSHAIYEGYTLPDNDKEKYSGEINVGGKLIYGHVFRCKDYNLESGYYRITFSIDSTGNDSNGNTVQGNVEFASTYDSNAVIMNADQLSEFSESVHSSITGSYVDMYLYPANGGGGKKN